MTSTLPIGNQLRDARDAQSLGVHDIEAILKIKATVIDMLESDDYQSQKIDVFTKGQLISYCKLLNINPQKIINCLEAKGYDFPTIQKAEPVMTKKSYPINLKILLPVFVLIIFIYALTGTEEVSEQPRFTQPLKQESYYDN